MTTRPEQHMTNLAETLERLSDYLGKRTHIVINGSTVDAFFFDIRTTGPRTIDYLIDTIDDLESQDLDVEYLLPIAVTGPGVDLADDVLKSDKGPLWGQFSGILFANMREGEGGKIPIYSAAVDGDVPPNMCKKVAEDVAELKAIQGVRCSFFGA